MEHNANNLAAPKFRVLGRWNDRMQRIDAGYLYEIGSAIRLIKAFRHKDVRAYELWSPLNRIREAVPEFLQKSVYSGSIRGVHIQAGAFLNAIDSLISRILNEKIDPVTSLDLAPVSNAFDAFEPALHHELSMLVTYLVLPKGAYDVLALVESGEKLFPASVSLKAPDAARDIDQGAKALAFELWSAAAFHFHRANEAVLRRYFDKHIGPEKRPKSLTMGTMLACLERENKGKPQVTVALQNLKEFHRNPNAHPGDFIEDAEEAFSLVAAIRTAMGYMLDDLDMLPFEELMDVASNAPSAPPLVVQ
jgi:hypothetical protein